jgi:hypothetical protein
MYLITKSVLIVTVDSIWNALKLKNQVFGNIHKKNISKRPPRFRSHHTRINTQFITSQLLIENHFDLLFQLNKESSCADYPN